MSEEDLDPVEERSIIEKSQLMSEADTDRLEHRHVS